MRAAFGLVGLLVTVGVIVWILSAVILPHQKEVIEKGQTASSQVEQIGGKDDNGMTVEESISYTPEMRTDGKLSGLTVSKLFPGGPMDKFFGLKIGDKIVAAVDGHGVRTVPQDVNDAKDMELAARTAYAEKGQLMVQRGGQTLTLPGGTPEPGAAPVAVPMTANTPAPAPPATGTPAAAPPVVNPGDPVPPKPGQDTTDDAMSQIRGRLRPTGMN